MIFTLRFSVGRVAILSRYSGLQIGYGEELESYPEPNDEQKMKAPLTS
jgi:hypothetical protein